MNKIVELLARPRALFDGGMGTMIAAAGLSSTAPEALCLTHPEAILRIHALYLEAGADVVTTNTLGVHPAKLRRIGEAERARELTAAAVAIARRAAEAHGSGFVALDLGPTGELLAPLGTLDFDAAIDGYAQVARVGKEAGADFALLETFGDIGEARAALLGAREAGLPAIASFTFEGGRMLMGGSPETAALAALAAGAHGVAVNCSQGPEAMAERLAAMRAVTDLPALVQPNAGVPHVKDGRTVFPLAPEAMAPMMRGILELGAWAIGGCCGTTPEHIRAFAPLLFGLSAPTDAFDGIARVCSQRAALPLDEAQTLAEDAPADLDELMDTEADVLRVDVRGLSEAELAVFLREAQQAVRKPLLFRARAEQEAAVLRYYHGKTVVGI